MTAAAMPLPPWRRRLRCCRCCRKLWSKRGVEPDSDGAHICCCLAHGCCTCNIFDTRRTSLSLSLSLSLEVCLPNSLPRDWTYYLLLLLLLLLQGCFTVSLAVCLLQHHCGLSGRNQHSGISRLLCHFNVANLFLGGGSNAFGLETQPNSLRTHVDRYKKKVCMQTLDLSPNFFFIFSTSFPYVKNEPNLFFIFPTSLNYVKNEPQCLFISPTSFAKSVP